MLCHTLQNIMGIMLTFLQRTWGDFVYLCKLRQDDFYLKSKYIMLKFEYMGHLTI